MSEKGIKEAEAGGKALADAGYSFDLAHTSLLTRAHTTLNKVLEAINQTNLPVERTWRLNERHYGGKIFVRLINSSSSICIMCSRKNGINVFLYCV